MIERGSVENGGMKIGNCFGGVDFDEKILESNCVAGMAIWDENSDRIECRVLLRWSGCDCSGLLRYFGWGDKFGNYHIGRRRTEFGVEGRLSDIESEIHGLVGRISG